MSTKDIREKWQPAKGSKMDLALRAVEPVESAYAVALDKAEAKAADVAQAQAAHAEAKAAPATMGRTQQLRHLQDVVGDRLAFQAEAEAELVAAKGAALAAALPVHTMTSKLDELKDKVEKTQARLAAAQEAVALAQNKPGTFHECRRAADWQKEVDGLQGALVTLQAKYDRAAAEYLQA